MPLQETEPTQTQVCQNQDAAQKRQLQVFHYGTYQGGWKRPVGNTLTRNLSETEKALPVLPVFLWHINSILFEYPEFGEGMVHTQKKTNRQHVRNNSQKASNECFHSMMKS